MEAIQELVSKVAYDLKIEFIILQAWRDGYMPNDILKEAAAELASLREELDALRLVADAARTGQGLDDALDALDALKGEK
jgi:hypothetical protein